MTHAEIEVKARALLRRFWEAKGNPPASEFFPLDTRAFIQEVLGWRCEAKDMVAVDLIGYCNVLGRCVAAGEGPGLVEVATMEVSANGAWSNPSVQRWTWAHEAGHIVLGHVGTGAGQSFECRRARPGVRIKGLQFRTREELTADVFARALLMPEKAVRQRFKELFGLDRVWAVRSAYSDLLGPSAAATLEEPSDEDLAQRLVVRCPGASSASLCDFFGVSRDAAKRRLLELHLVFA